MTPKILLLLAALAAYAAMLSYDLRHPETILARTDSPPGRRPSRSLPVATTAELDLSPREPRPFREPSRDVFDYRVPVARPVDAPPPPRPAPAPPPPAPAESRIKRDSIEVHGIYERKDPPSRKVFLSIDGVLCIAEPGEELPGGLRLQWLGPKTVTIRSVEGDAEESFDLP